MLLMLCAPSRGRWMSRSRCFSWTGAQRRGGCQHHVRGRRKAQRGPQNLDGLCALCRANEKETLKGLVAMCKKCSYPFVPEDKTHKRHESKQLLVDTEAYHFIALQCPSSCAQCRTADSHTPHLWPLSRTRKKMPHRMRRCLSA